MRLYIHFTALVSLVEFCAVSLTSILFPRHMPVPSFGDPPTLWSRVLPSIILSKRPVTIREGESLHVQKCFYFPLIPNCCFVWTLNYGFKIIFSHTSKLLHFYLLSLVFTNNKTDITLILSVVDKLCLLSGSL